MTAVVVLGFLQWTLGAQAIALGTRASPAHAGRSLTEGYLSQPMVMATLSALDDRIGLHGMLDLEGLTLERGELDAGIWGEGYARQHATAINAGAVFDPRAFYGSNTMWSTTAGLTLTAGMIHRRTGVYGAASRRMSGMSM